MQGPEGTATRVTGWLADRLPTRLRLLETALGLDPASLPDPSLVVDHETGPLGLEDWPAVIVLPQRLESLEYVDDDAAGEVYRAGYALEVLAWLRADDYPATDQLRRRYALALREALLERKQLTAAQAYPAERVASPFEVDPRSIREDYGPVITDEARRTIAGVRVLFTVTVLEVLAGPAPMGTADTVTVTTGPLTHPGLM